MWFSFFCVIVDLRYVFSFRNDENDLSVVKDVIHCKNEFVISTMQIVVLVAY